MKHGEVAFETPIGKYRNIFLPIPITHNKSIIVPSLLFTSSRSGESRDIFSFRVRKRGSARQIIADCVLGNFCYDPKYYLENTQFFVPGFYRRLPVLDKIPLVMLHTISEEEKVGPEFNALLSEVLGNPQVGTIFETDSTGILE